MNEHNIDAQKIRMYIHYTLFVNLQTNQKHFLIIHRKSDRIIQPVYGKQMTQVRNLGSS